MQSPIIEYDKGSLEYDPNDNGHLRFTAPQSEARRIVDILKAEGIVNFERNYSHFLNVGVGIRAFIEGREPAPPYFTMEMIKIGSGLARRADIKFDALKEGGKTTAAQVESGKLTIAQIAKVLGLYSPHPN